jgi:hypothetical protein
MPIEPINQVALQHEQYFLVFGKFQNQGCNNGFSEMCRMKIILNAMNLDYLIFCGVFHKPYRAPK